MTSGDYLEGFFLGTREAIFESNRGSITLTILKVDSFVVGMLISLFERAVGLYSLLINVNAYHQPGVEAGKKAASDVIGLQVKALQWLAGRRGTGFTVEEIGRGLGAADHVEALFKICEHLAANPDRGVRRQAGETPFKARYSLV